MASYGLSGTSSNSTLDMVNRYTDVNGEDYSAYVNRRKAEEELQQLYEDKTTLDFTDMLQLMIAQFQNQTIDNQADTNDMMNQLVSMSTMQAMNQMVDSVEELRLANVMSYAASLVDKDVTIGIWQDTSVMLEDGTTTTVRKLNEIYGRVTGMATYNGQQVIFLDNGNMYYLSEILAVGKLPPKEDDEKVEHAYGCEDPDCEGECMENIQHAEDCDDPECKGECTEEPKLPEDTTVQTPDVVDPGYTVDDKEPEGSDSGATEETQQQEQD